MALLIKSTVRAVFYHNRTKCINFRNIMTSASRAEKALEQLETNPYFDKYAEKIAKLQKTSPEEFLKRIDEQEQKKAALKAPIEQPARNFTNILKPKAANSGATNTNQHSLDTIMKTELIKDNTTEEIKAIWLKYHVLKTDVIAASLTPKVFDEMQGIASKYPTFLFPLPRSQGYEFIMSQFDGDSIHFTPLICYQVHKENAPECLTIKYYTELRDGKDIILMRGEYDNTVINSTEALCLANQLQLYYSLADEVKMKILRTFTDKPDEFKHNDLIKQVESLSL